jgi:hypothetical protein
MEHGLMPSNAGNTHGAPITVPDTTVTLNPTACTAYVERVGTPSTVHGDPACQYFGHPRPAIDHRLLREGAASVRPGGNCADSPGLRISAPLFPVHVDTE